MRVPNHKLENYFARYEDIENYNGTIRGFNGLNGDYTVRHWSTDIAVIAPDYFAAYPHYISQTTASLLGRVMRSQPRGNVIAWIDRELALGTIDVKRARQLSNQLR